MATRTRKPPAGRAAKVAVPAAEQPVAPAETPAVTEQPVEPAEDSAAAAAEAQAKAEAAARAEKAAGATPDGLAHIRLLEPVIRGDEWFAEGAELDVPERRARIWFEGRVCEIGQDDGSWLSPGTGEASEGIEVGIPDDGTAAEGTLES